jgi:hypothetical protein
MTQVADLTLDLLGIDTRMLTAFLRQVHIAWPRCRTLSGWGLPAQECLGLAHVRLIGGWLFLPLGAFVLVLETLFALHEVRTVPPLRVYVAVSLACATLALCFLVIGIRTRRRGRRAQASLPQVAYGQCFDVFAIYEKQASVPPASAVGMNGP